MKGRCVILSGLLLPALWLAGCSGNECYENHSALPLASFFNASNSQAVTLQRVEIYGIGAPGDSILYTAQSLREAYLPFRLWQDSTQYVFAYYGLVNAPEPEEGEEQPEVPTVVPADTVTFRYTPREWFVSPACGAMYFYNMKSVSHTSYLIDSIAFNEVITNENVANIKIFFREEMAAGN